MAYIHWSFWKLPATKATIDFQPALAGKLFGPLHNLSLFNQMQIDPEAHTLVWPNGADFDPATLHDWPEHAEELSIHRTVRTDGNLAGHI